MPRKRNIEGVAKPEPNDSIEAIDWSAYLTYQLKAELDRRGLSKLGKKADLVARLQASDDGTLEPEPAVQNIAPSADSGASQKKRAKKEESPDVVIEGQLASELIIYQKIDTRTGERREKDFVPEPDAKFKDKVKRIRKERMFMLNRQKSYDKRGRTCEKFDIAGSTGNIYQTQIGRSPSCTCMDAVSSFLPLRISFSLDL